MIGAGRGDVGPRHAHWLAGGRQAKLGVTGGQRVQDLLDDEAGDFRDAQIAGEHLAQLVEEVELLVRVDDLSGEAVDLLLQPCVGRRHAASSRASASGGSATLKVLPTPGWESTHMRP